MPRLELTGEQIYALLAYLDEAQAHCIQLSGKDFREKIKHSQKIEALRNAIKLQWYALPDEKEDENGEEKSE